ncbi:MAG: hypothetical protein ABSF25_25625 [Bryobacteraceae bacterium]|jgi:predicted DNA binding CopG/RHH family protein
MPARITIRIPQELLDRVREEAAAQNLPASRFVGRIVEAEARRDLGARGRRTAKRTR